MTRMRRSSRKAPWVSSASARPRSASRLRSWNSSKSTAATPSSVGSSRIMRVKMPSVTTSTRVRADTFEPKRTLRPTRPPTSSPRVLAIRSATARAAMRRGSSTRILPVPDQDSSISTSGTRVDLPAPGGATRTARVAPARASRRAGNAASMGRSDRDTPGVYGSFTASASAGAAKGPNGPNGPPACDVFAKAIGCSIAGRTMSTAGMWTRPGTTRPARQSPSERRRRAAGRPVPNAPQAARERRSASCGPPRPVRGPRQIAISPTRLRTDPRLGYGPPPGAGVVQW